MHRSTTSAEACLCGHGLPAHEHYRRADICSLCSEKSCDHYRRPGRWSSWRKVVSRIGLADPVTEPAPAPTPVPGERPHLYLVR